jgi:hypothetical protein
MNKQNQSIVQIIRWCDEQERQATETINHLLDTKRHKTKIGKKALTIASNILKSIDALREISNEGITTNA